MKATQLLAAATLAISSACAFATPQYIGDTNASNITGSNMNTGYYIWNDNDNAQNWHIRWTSTNAVPNNDVDWFGSIVFHGGSYETPANPEDLEFKFEGNDESANIQNNPWVQDLIGWNAHTNDTGGVDGLDFTVDSDLEILEFNLGSSLFNNLDLNHLDALAEEATNIYIGDGFAKPNVLVFQNNNGDKYQSFEVSVPEPGTLALLGLGLAGLGFARRKQA